MTAAATVVGLARRPPLFECRKQTVIVAAKAAPIGLEAGVEQPGRRARADRQKFRGGSGLGVLYGARRRSDHQLRRRSDYHGYRASRFSGLTR